VRPTAGVVHKFNGDRGNALRLARIRVIEPTGCAHEVLNGFIVINERHLDYTLRIGSDWYNKRRGHSGLDHLPPMRDNDDPPVVDLAQHKVVCHTELGWHLKSYRSTA
jgi:hypothetical protein